MEYTCAVRLFSELRTVCREIAVEVARKAREQNVAGKPVDTKQLGEIVNSKMLVPTYPRFTGGAERVE
jgi:hypothetical protein